MEEHLKKRGAINVLNISKGYGSKHDRTVLNRLNLSVESGSIYGLLGSSGCGKTTLLSCIIGLHKPDSGHILLFGNKVNGVAGRVVGFMPQDVGLYDSFTIEETFVYFANMYDISHAILIERLSALKDLLSIPKLSSSIKSLSGGEKRRVSLAVTLLHRPRLLVLDEPTVGVDPLLRVKIWGYLTKLVKSDGITILVTTHYTQEASHCNKIGILRNGRLLVEESPQELLDKFNTNLLEKVVLDLCRKDEVSNSDRNNGAMLMKTKSDHEHENNEALAYDLTRHMDLCDVEVVGVGENSLKDSGTDSFSSKLTKLKGLVKRNWINEFRHFQLVLILIAIPLINVLLGVYVIGLEPKGLKLGIVNQDLSYMKYLDGRTEHCYDENEATYSCIFMKQLEAAGVKLETYASETDALESVVDGRSTGYLIIPQNFTEHLYNRFLLKHYSDSETLNGSTIGVRLDMSQFIRRVFLLRTLTNGLQTSLQKIVQGFGVDPRISELPLRFNAIYGSVDSTWRDYFMPTYILFSIFILQTVAGLFHIQDKKNGTLQRTLVTGVTHTEVLISYILSTIPILVVQIVTMILLMSWEVEIAGSWWLVFVQVFLTGLSGVMIGLICASIFNHEMEVVVAVLFIFLTCQSLSGITWPLDSVVLSLRIFCYTLPTTYPLTAMRSIMNRGWDSSNPQIVIGLAISFVYTFGCLLIIVLVKKYQK